MQKTVLVTGASSGFGTFLARAFARAGYVVVLHGRDAKRLSAVRDEIVRAEKAECPVIIADLRSADGLATVKKAFQEWNVDVLINNAAVNPQLEWGAVSDVEKIDAVVSTNISAAIALCYAAFSHFAARGGGAIVNINSVAGLRGSSREAVYAASKFGLRGFSESVKEEWLKHGVRMIDVYPGAMAAGMSGKRPDAQKLIDPGELAGLLVYLCGTKSFYVQSLAVRRTIVE